MSEGPSAHGRHVAAESSGPATARRRSNRRSKRAAVGSTRHSLLVGVLIFYLVIEYIRIPFLLSLRLQLLFLAVLPVFWLASRERTWSRTLTLQLLFVVTGALAIPFAHNYFVVYANTRTLLGAIVVALATTWLLAFRTPFKKVLWAWVAIICFQAAWAIGHDGHGYGSFMGDENDLALACVMAFPASFLGFQYLRGARRWVCGGIALLLLAGIVASFSRGGFLGLLAAFGYMLFAGANRARNLALCAAAGIAFLVVIPTDYRDEIGTIRETQSGTAEERLFLWVTAARMWADHPFFGVGPRNSAYLLERYQPEPMGDLFSGGEFQNRRWGMKKVHSTYFELLAERGLVGFGLFSAIAFFFYKQLRQLRREVAKRRGDPIDLVRDASMYALALESGLAGYLVAGAFLSMLSYPYFWFFTALGVAHERAIRREFRVKTSAAKRRS